MKHFFTIFILLMLFVVSISIAQTNWTKDSTNNPVLTPGPAGAWDEGFAAVPSVIFDGSTYHLWYGAYNGVTTRWDGIGYATSNDGISWTKYDDPATTNPPYSQSDPVLTPGPGNYDNIGAGLPSVLKLGAEYHMWYASDNHAAGNQGISISHATSLNGIHWIKDSLNNPVLDVGSNGTWDDTWVNSPSVVFDGSMYHMWYAAWNGNAPPDNVRIGHATAIHPDSAWTKDIQHNPVLVFGTSTCWDYDRVDAPAVVFDGTIFHMFYSGGYMLTWRIGYAWSLDGSNWFKYNNPSTSIPLFSISDPVLFWGPYGTWDDSNVSHCSVLLDTLADSLRMWYTGGDAAPSSGTAQVGYATAPFSTHHVPGNYPTIQAAINSASAGDIVLVADGTYLENINFKGKAITVASHYYFDGDTSHISNTIIDGSDPSHPDSGSVVYFVSGEDTNSVLSGFTITGGTGTIDSPNNWRNGGGIYATDSSPHLKNNIIESNIITYNNDSYGGGIYVLYLNNNFIIENNMIRNNELISSSVTDYSLGAGIYVAAGGTETIRIFGNRIINNAISAPVGYGCGITPANVGNANYLIFNNIVSGNIINAPSGASGGIDIYEHFPMVHNNLFTNNTAPIGAGIGIEFTSAKTNESGARGSKPRSKEHRLDYKTSNVEIVKFSNNTVVNNSATVSGGGIGVIGGTIPQLINLIVWGNTAPSNPQISGTADVQYSDVEGGYSGTGNINSDPFFADSVFNLADSSLCIGAGIDSIEISGTWYYAPPFDYDGDPRPNPVDNFVDMGAQESPFPKIIDIIKKDLDNLPKIFSLKQNYPNPFNPSTTIEFSIPKVEYVNLIVYNLLGQEVTTLVSEKLTPGEYKYTWDASHLASGVYIYKIQTDNGFTKTKKLLLIK